MKFIREKIAVIVTALLLSLGIISLALVQYAHKPETKTPVTITNIPSNAYTFATPDKIFKYFFEPTPNTDITWTPDWLATPIVNHINSDTIHDTREFSPNKKTGIYRIVTIGDSFTFGQFVRSEENYSSRLEVLLNSSLKCPGISGYEVINLGVYGYDVTYSMERLKRRGLKYTPDLVIYLVNEWNITSLNEQRIPLQEYLNTKGILTYDPNNQKINPAVILAIEAVRKTMGITTIVNTHAQAIDSLRQLYRGPMIVISKHFPDKSLNEFLTKETQKNSIIYDDLGNILDDPQSLLADRHPNALGHSRIAGAVRKSITSHILTACVSTR